MGEPYTLLLSALLLTGGVFIFLLGLTLLRAGSSSAPVRATALMLFFAAIGPILSGSSIILQSTLREDAVVYRSMVDNFEYLWEFYFPSLLLFSLTFPKEHRFFGNFVLLGVLIFAPYIFHLVTIMAGEGLSESVVDLSRHLPIQREVSVGDRSFSLAGTSNVLSALFATLVKLHKQLFLLVNIAYASVALALLTRSQRGHLNPRITGQLRTVVIGLSISILGYSVAKFVRFLPGFTSKEGVSLALTNVALVVGGGSVAYAVIKQQLLGLRYVLRRSILYGAAAVVFAFIYLLVVRPVSDYFGKYSVVSEGTFETGFIILAIIAFQPLLFRIEDVLEGILFRGTDDLQTRFNKLGKEIANVTNEEELAGLLRRALRDILDATSVRLNLDGTDARERRLIDVLDKIGGPIMRHELLELGQQEHAVAEERGAGGIFGGLRRRFRKRPPFVLEDARELVGDDEMFVPIYKERKCVGYLSVGEKTHGMRYNADELALVSSIANQIGVALDNIRLLRENVEKKVIEEELLIARRIQSQLLPSRSPEIAGYQLSAATVPSRHVGGDYYDFEVLDDGQLVVVVADVSGKGIPASLLMATLHAAVNSNHDAKRQPVVMLDRINGLLYESTSPEEFATVFYGVVDLESGRMKYANAGHEFPFIVRGENVDQLGESGIVLGCMPEFAYEECQCEIPAGGTLILYTDGVTDAATTGGESYGEARFRDALSANGRRPSEDLCKALLDGVRSFSKGGDYQDDLTLVVLKRE